MNLIHSSIKLTPDGGKISLSATRIGQNIHLTVTDTGIDISRRNQKQIFPGYDTDEKQGCRGEETGLGLSLVKSLIKLHGGRVIVSSKHKSAKVTCVIPLNLQQAAQPQLPNMAIM